MKDGEKLEKKQKHGGMDPKKQKIISITTLVIGLILLVVGVVMLVLRLTQGEEIADGEYLVEKGQWSLEGSDGVVWNFTELGKGTLTTNNHQNDYDFTWSIEDSDLSIETDWLYELENDYSYSLDREKGVLKLQDGDGSYTFTAQ